ncbi:hypothetical protein J8J27_33230, partial [Mycobacterium tuberculosis]|nr:hypothetical protein [Mycobacterium tuberculosis]
LPTLRPEERPALVVWSGRRPPPAFAAAAGPATTVTVPWPAGLLARAGRATSVWSYVTLP